MMLIMYAAYCSPVDRAFDLKFFCSRFNPAREPTLFSFPFVIGQLSANFGIKMHKSCFQYNHLKQKF